jgi:peptidoglycan hydrolase-like protein with peptidoglycan-binding domain
LRKKKKATVHRDEPRKAKPIAATLTVAAFAGCCAILFNAFVTQGRAPAGRLAAVQEDGSTRVAVSSDQKTSRTITLKYDPLVEDIQRELLATGHFSGLVDGVTGPKTKVAIEAYQRENKIDVTGGVTKGLLEHIQYTRKINQAAEFTGSVSASDVAPIKHEPVAAPVAAKPKPAVAASGDKAIARLQLRLAKLGYDPGSRSGQLDEGTRSAILIFEMDHGLPMQGKISKPLLNALKTAESKSAAK